MPQFFLSLIIFIVMHVNPIMAVATDLKNPPLHNPPYPEIWWQPVSKEGAPTWEIMPQDAKYGEVILSKRGELGILSNFAPTPFTYKGKTYASVEGFWQATKYPENDKDERAIKFKKWPFTRDQVEKMSAFEAKDAGTLASDIMKIIKVDWVTFNNKKMVYKEPGDSEYYHLIVEVMSEKLKQNPEVESLLRRTGDLVLMPDHVPGPDELKAWQYHKIWMEFRKNLK